MESLLKQKINIVNPQEHKVWYLGLYKYLFQNKFSLITPAVTLITDLFQFKHHTEGFEWDVLMLCFVLW